jgi:hypothetical protein
MTTPPDDTNISLLSPLFADGRSFLTLGALGLLFSGAFALFLAATSQFLPHDIKFLGMTADQLCAQNGCRIVHFMIHDRVSFGGTLIGISIFYYWLIHFPLRARRPWAWWALLLSNLAGFSSFLTYLGFGYLDTWHGVATLFLLPCFAIGLALTYRTLDHPRRISSLLSPAHFPTAPPRFRLGRRLLLAVGAAMLVGGLTITILGITAVFVPQDLQYLGTTPAQLNVLNPRLIPLIAHDRAGFGGGVFNVGLLIVVVTWCGNHSRHLWQATLAVGLIGFGAAIGIHPIVGYNNPVHLAPACAGAATYFVAMALTFPSKTNQKNLTK